MVRRLIAALLLPVIAAPAATAEVYRVVDDQGRVTFTDTPPPDTGERVEIAPLNVLPAARKAAAPLPGQATGQVAAYRSLVLEGVSQNALLKDPESLTVSASPIPPLQPGHEIVLIHNGAVIGGEGASATVEQPAAGAHVFSAQVRDARGQVLIASLSVTVLVEREDPVKARPGASRRRRE